MLAEALDLKSPLEHSNWILSHSSLAFSSSRGFNQEPGHAVSTMNRSSALDLKSPLERGGGMLLPTGSVHVQLRQECSVGEKGPPGKKSEPRSLDSSGEGN